MEDPVAQAVHRSWLVPPGARAVPLDRSDAATLTARVGGDPEELGRLLAAVEPLRADAAAVVATDAHAEVERFLAVLAVLDGRAPLPDHDLDDPALKWHAPAGVRAVPNRPDRDAGGAA
jgi:hypothetical protein